MFFSENGRKMNSWKFWSCVTLSDSDYEFSMNNDLNHTNSIPLSPVPSSPPSSASSNGNLPSNAFVKGLILTKDEIISLINDFNLDPHSYRLNSSLIISAKCADYRPAKAILLCVCHHALIMHGKVSDLSICKSILEVYKSHSKKPSIIMLSYASVLSLLLNESNHDQFIEFGLHRCLASPYDSWKYNPNESIESSKLSLLCWKIVIIAILTAHNLETRKTFGDASSCEWIVQVLEELLKLSKELSLNSQSVLSGSPRISSAHAPAPVPLPNLINTFVISCCVALIHLTKDYRTNFQKISSITLDTGSRFDLFLEEILVPSRRMQYSILTDDTWSGLSLTKEYFQVNLQCSVQLPPPPPALSSLCPTSPSQLVSIPDTLTALLQRYSPTSSYFPSLVSMVYSSSNFISLL